MVKVFTVARIPRPHPFFASAGGLDANAWLWIPGLKFSLLIFLRIVAKFFNDKKNQPYSRPHTVFFLTLWRSPIRNSQKLTRNQHM